MRNREFILPGLMDFTVDIYVLTQYKNKLWLIKYFKIALRIVL